MRPSFVKAQRSLATGSRSIILGAAFGGILLHGCATNEKIKLAADGAPEYQNLQISYDLASTPAFERLDQPVQQTASVEPAAHGQSPPTNRPWTRRRVHLDLQYPYPGLHPAFARATLRIVVDNTKPEEKPHPAESKNLFSFTFTSPSGGTSVSGTSAVQPAKNSATTEPSRLPSDDQSDLVATEEVLYIDLPKTELDKVLAELAKAEFFKLPSNPDGASHVAVVLNKGRCEKGWARDEQLDRLVELLRRHGAPLPAPMAQPKKT